MNDVPTSRSERRLQEMYEECQDHVITQIIGPFGLSQAMFEDRNGGNVTTLRNFRRLDADYVASEDDKVRHAAANTQYDAKVRRQFEVKTEQDAEQCGTRTFGEKRKAKIEAGVDEYTGARFTRGSDGTLTLSDGTGTNPEVDHIISINDIHEDPATYLSMADVEDGHVNMSRAAAVVNDDNNLALTNKSLNASKGAKDVEKWMQQKNEDGVSNADRYGLDLEQAKKLHAKAKHHVESSKSRALLEKQAKELLQTGSDQAARMGLKQALGVLLVELVNGLFNECREMIRSGVELSTAVLKDIARRLRKLATSLARKLPGALMQGLQGGVSGFISNLVTFMLNTFLSTAKRFVTAIRDSLLGLFKALKMIFFPPTGISTNDALQQGIKMLAAVVVGVAALLMQESITAFLVSIPLLAPFAEVVSAGMLAIISGLVTAFVCYQITRLFDNAMLREEQIDAAMASAEKQQEIAEVLAERTSLSLDAIAGNMGAILAYQDTGRSLATVGAIAYSTALLIDGTVTLTRERIESAEACIQKFDQSLARIDSLLRTA